MKKIIEYKILSDCEARFLSDKVQNAISNGLQPKGKLHILKKEDGTMIYFQCVVKYEQNL
jgi:hypothetical protein